MKENHLEQSQQMLASQDLNQLLQRGRTLHDQAVFDFLSRLVMRGQLLFKKYISISAHSSKAKYHGSRGVPYIR